MIDFEMEIDASKVITMLDGQKMRLSRANREAFLRRSGARMVTSITKNFQKQGRPDKWAPLAPATIRRRPKGQRKNPRILMVTAGSGGLLGSIAYEIHAGGWAVEIGTNKKYAPFLQKGLHPTGSMPAREHIMFQERDKKKIEQDAKKTFG